MTEHQELWDWLHDSNFKWDCVSDEEGVVRIIFFVDDKETSDADD